MGLPLPTSWYDSAVAVLVRTQRKAARRPAKKTPRTKTTRAKGPAKSAATRAREKFQNVVMREKFYQIVGHHAVNDVRQRTKNPKTKEPYTAVEFATVLGIDSTQIGRWHAEKTFIRAENFFAFQLLILNKPLSTLRLSPNAELVWRSVASMVRFLRRRYDRAGPGVLTRDEWLRLVWLMTEMSRTPQAVFNPHTGRADDPTNAAALAALADRFLARSVSSRQVDPAQEQAIRTNFITHARDLLTNWGLGYSLFALGQVDRWRALEVVE